ncbi:MAG: polyprenyl synthetase family protein [Suipraeoptans sp.]
MNSNKFSSEIEIRKQEIEDIIKEYLPQKITKQRIIADAMEYSLMAGGKRLRPMLMNETYKILGGVGTEIKPFLAAIEMIHTYSLVHDDLPAMDDDELRRGRKTTHIVYGEDMGILAGDSLLNYAFETALRAFDYCDNNKRIVDAMKVLSKNAGVFGMIGGQVVDVKETGTQIDKDTLDFIYRLKTGALVEASMTIGAIMAGADNEIVEDMKKIASYVGMAFQIQDDILDVTSTEDQLGKPINSDYKNNKTTYVTLYGIEEAGNQVKLYSEKALLLLNKYCNKDTFLYSLIVSLINRKK